ncbi:CoA-binding protein [Sphingomonas arenae]|uniref:CoA-binding protein n=1 Tax=Sphingomonas arenae TaxID=2812555 RepID=UPI0019675D4A|nr:CoA-binding protein [Sphingomonas arenae]
MPIEDDRSLARLLSESRAVAVVGASNRPERASYGVMRFLLERGWRVMPVNPRLEGGEILGQRVRASLASIDEPIDIVDVFRRSEDAGGVVDEAIAVGAKAVWLQLGVVDDKAAARAEAAGLKVVMDRCIKIDAARLRVGAP